MERVFFTIFFSWLFHPNFLFLIFHSQVFSLYLFLLHAAGTLKFSNCRTVMSILFYCTLFYSVSLTNVSGSLITWGILVPFAPLKLWLILLNRREEYISPIFAWNVEKNICWPCFHFRPKTNCKINFICTIILNGSWTWLKRVWKDKQRRWREVSDGEKTSWKTPVVRTEDTGCEQPQRLFCLWKKPGNKGVSTGRKRRERASEGREWTERAKTETCVGQSAASEDPWCIRSHSINTTRSGWWGEDEEKGGEEAAWGLHRRTGFAGLCGKIDGAWCDCVKATKKQDQLGRFSKCKQLRGDTSTPPPLSKSYDLSECWVRRCTQMANVHLSIDNL